jgi:type VI secretion system protein ImpJ
MGQTLLPQHFTALEESVLADTVARFRSSGLPAHGIAALRWNPSLVEEGILSVSALTMVLPSGLLVDVPGNAKISPLNLNLSGSASVSAYLHVLEGERDAADSVDASDESGVPRLVHRLVLSSDATISSALESTKLAEFRKAPDGLWQISDRWVPPLLAVGTSPFLTKELDEIAPALEVFQYKLAMDSASYLSGAALYLLQSTLRSVYRVQRLLANVRKHVHLHPYFVYETLKDFYVEVCFYRGATPRDATAPYRHDQLAACFREILEPLREQMQLAKSQSPYQPFVLREGVQRIELPADIRQVREVYFLIQRKETQRAGSIMGDLKLSSPSRLSMVHKLALEGIPFRRAERPALAHAFGPEVEFYQLAPGEEWEHAMRENSVAFYHRPEYQGLEFYLYWNRA